MFLSNSIVYLKNFLLNKEVKTSLLAESRAISHTKPIIKIQLNINGICQLPTTRGKLNYLMSFLRQLCSFP